MLYSSPCSLLPRFYSGSGPSALSPDGQILYSCSLSRDNTPSMHATLINSPDVFSSLPIPTNDEQQDIPIAMSASEEFLYVSFRSSSSIQVYRWASRISEGTAEEPGRKLESVQSIVQNHGTPVIQLFLISNLNLLLSASTDKTIRVWRISPETGTLISPHIATLRPGAVTPYLAVTSSTVISVSTEGFLHTWKIDKHWKPSGVPIDVSSGTSVSSLDIIREQMAIVGLTAGIVVLVDLKARSVIQRVGIPGSPELYSLVASYDSILAATGGGLFQATVTEGAVPAFSNILEGKYAKILSSSSRIVALGDPSLPLVAILAEDGSCLHLTLGDPGEITDAVILHTEQLCFSSDFGVLISVDNPGTKMVSWPRVIGRNKDEPILAIASCNGFITTCSQQRITLYKVELDGGFSVMVSTVTNAHQSCVAISKVTTGAFPVIFSAGIDGMIRQWKVSSTSLIQEAAVPHSGESVSSLALSEDWIITGSHDKTAKIWRVSGISPVLHTHLVGHSRPIWSVAISSAQQIAATGSSDQTIRIWSLRNGSALVVLGGPGADGSHLGSILRIVLFEKYSGAANEERKSLLWSTGSDGLVKAWSWRQRECLSTVEVGDANSQKPWALLATEAWVISGAGTLFWDQSEEARLASQQASLASLAAEQELRNAIVLGDYRSGVKLALQHEQPMRLLQLLRKDPSLVSVLLDLIDDHRTTMIHWVADWITRPADAPICHRILEELLKRGPLESPEALRSLIAYSERLWERIDDTMCLLAPASIFNKGTSL